MARAADEVTEVRVEQTSSEIPSTSSRFNAAEAPGCTLALCGQDYY